MGISDLRNEVAQDRTAQQIGPVPPGVCSINRASPAVLSTPAEGRERRLISYGSGRFRPPPCTNFSLDPGGALNHVAISGSGLCQAQFPQASNPVDLRLLLRAILAHRLTSLGLFVGTYLKFSLSLGFGI